MICLDTTPLIWGMQVDEHADEYKRTCMERTKAYLDVLAKARTMIMLPTPVVMEYLTGIPESAHVETLRQLRTFFQIYPFDELASLIAAGMAISPTYKRVVADVSGQTTYTRETIRQFVKVDAMIIAIAIARGAECIISADPHLQALASERIPVIPVPNIDIQLDLKLPDTHPSTDQH